MRTHARLVLIAALIPLVGACATTSEPSPAGPEMRIDFARGKVITPHWEADFTDCSDAAIQCIEVPGRFVMAFPKSCPRGVADWQAAGYRFRMTAPTPHYGAPSGGYISDKYPHIHLSWSEGSGFVALRRTAKTPYDQGWDPNDTVEDYRVRYVGAHSAFACS